MSSTVHFLRCCLIVSPKSGNTMDHAGSSSHRDFCVFNLQATFLLGFLLNFASGLLWQRSGHPIVLVGQELKLGSGESKMSKFYYATIAYHVGLNAVLGLPHPGPTS